MEKMNTDRALSLENVRIKDHKLILDFNSEFHRCYIMMHQQGSLEHKRGLDKVFLSPFLFLVAIEGLINMVKATNTNG